MRSDGGTPFSLEQNSPANPSLTSLAPVFCLSPARGGCCEEPGPPPAGAPPATADALHGEAALPFHFLCFAPSLSCAPVAAAGGSRREGGGWRLPAGDRRRARGRRASAHLFPSNFFPSLFSAAPASGHGSGWRQGLCPRRGLSLSAVAGQAPPLPGPSSQMPLRGAHRDRAGQTRPETAAFFAGEPEAQNPVSFLCPLLGFLCWWGYF
jgi:hypothetical protein